MASDSKPRVKVPKSASAGEVITIKALISHKMESGQRKDADGNLIPRGIVNGVTCDLAGEYVGGVAIAAAVWSNPYFECDGKVDAACEIKFTWYDADGDVYEDTQTTEIA